ncbi:hypothetical protein [Peribacillus simplex]|uniref:hypothetical protein n=1 Tax=Peribacillus simplex TaxID=1478 RepID=UPI0021A63A43|nr:hypothetical protein [Peribacillus simplex]
MEERIENREIFTYTKGSILLGIGIIETSKYSTNMEISACLQMNNTEKTELAERSYII